MRFHFNVRAPAGAVVDRDGAEFANAEDAYQAAARTARSLLRDGGNIDWLGCVVEVADADGEVAFELAFTEAVEITPERQ